jgi:hypothetical protein
MKNRKKQLVDAHLDTIRHAIVEIQKYLDQGKIEQAQNWTVPILSAAKHIEELTTSKKAVSE